MGEKYQESVVLEFAAKGRDEQEDNEQPSNGALFRPLMSCYSLTDHQVVHKCFVLFYLEPLMTKTVHTTQERQPPCLSTKQSALH